MEGAGRVRWDVLKNIANLLPPLLARSICIAGCQSQDCIDRLDGAVEKLDDFGLIRQALTRCEGNLPTSKQTL
jgi:hypothetical protein